MLKMLNTGMWTESDDSSFRTETSPTLPIIITLVEKSKFGPNLDFEVIQLLQVAMHVQLPHFLVCSVPPFPSIQFHLPNRPI